MQFSWSMYYNCSLWGSSPFVFPWSFHSSHDAIRRKHKSQSSVWPFHFIASSCLLQNINANQVFCLLSSGLAIKGLCSQFESLSATVVRIFLYIYIFLWALRAVFFILEFWYLPRHAFLGKSFSTIPQNIAHLLTCILFLTFLFDLYVWTAPEKQRPGSVFELDNKIPRALEG